jgi:dimethylamine monooxygenase subunit B
MSQPLKLVVSGIDDTVAGIRSLTLSAPNSGRLPPFVPGSHLVLDCGGRQNAYSLTGEGVDPFEYRISVLKVSGGAGGSAWVHECLAVGDTTSALLPRSAFAPVARARKHLLVAGGIGITPIVSHLRAARTWHREVQVLYVHREDSPAHVDEVRELAGDAADIVTARADFRQRLGPLLAGQPLGTHLYTCGPPGLIDDVLAMAAGHGWPASRLHSERFGADVLDPGEPFDVVLGETGTRLTVPSGTSLLEALERHGIAIPNLCRHGVCGECRIPVTGGVPLHRDLYLTDEEKQTGDALMCCVSRSKSPALEVPL